MAQFNKDLSNWEHSQSLVLNMLEQHTSKIDELTKQGSEVQKEIEVIKTLISANTEDVKTLLKVVRDGNGSSLVSRVQNIERDVDILQEANKISSAEKKEIVQFRRAVLSGVLVSIAASLYTVLQVTILGK